MTIYSMHAVCIKGERRDLDENIVTRGEGNI